MAKKTLKQSFEEAKAYLLNESNKVLPFTIKDGREWPKIDNDYMCESFLNGCSKVAIRNFDNFKESILKAYINYGETHYTFYYKEFIKKEIKND